ncbi:MAG: HTTM domain-containing protein, partial [Myxococcales bacterium]|nr:HTTM domain-containing protein [Myxococcales bacterium]
MTAIRTWLTHPVASDGLRLFRTLFGALMLFATIRFVWNGWVDELYVAPTFHFTYLGFDWIRPWGETGMYVHFTLMGLSAFSLMMGVVPRLSALFFGLLFTYVELLDQATYLNHYYLVSLLSFLLAVVPVGPGGTVGRWTYVTFRCQIAVVYLFAGIAKINSDWLWRAEPVHTWLGSFAHFPVVGELLTSSATAFAMSWAGATYDLCIVPLLLCPKTRPYAVAASVFFHLTIWILFPVGIFSWVMLLSITVFFEPTWPRRVLNIFTNLEKTVTPITHHTAPPPAWLVPILVLHIGLQVALPLRHLAYRGNVNWTEEGFRFAWRVMLVEKTGQVEYVVETSDGERVRVFPSHELSPLQL